MPHFDGLALLAHVRAGVNPLPVIVVLGSWSEEQRDRELGAARLLSKPVDLAQLGRDAQEVAG